MNKTIIKTNDNLNRFSIWTISEYVADPYSNILYFYIFLAMVESSIFVLNSRTLLSTY